MAKNTALRLVRSLARKAGYSETRYDVVMRSRARVCEVWLRRQPGLHLMFDPPPRASALLLGRGRSWDVAAFRAARALGVDARRVA